MHGGFPALTDTTNISGKVQKAHPNLITSASAEDRIFGVSGGLPCRVRHCHSGPASGHDGDVPSSGVVPGHFGNRFSPSQPRAIYPTSIEVVLDDTPLQLVGPGLQVVSAVGLKADAP